MMTSLLARTLLYAPAKVYELGVRTRIALYDAGYLKAEKLRTPVVSIGNLTIGGTGKTPFTAWLANYLQSEGFATGILSRGYKRRGRGIVEVSNGSQILAQAREAGDEPYLLAQACPGVRVVVAKLRAEAGRWLEDRANLSALVLDDGFQHLALARQLNIALIDATSPTGGDRMVPFGRLREPLTSLLRADAVVVTRADHPFDQGAVEETIRKYCRKSVPVFYAYHDVTSLIRMDRSGRMKPVDLAHERVAALAAIARPAIFLKDLAHYGATIVLHREFPDHHIYRDAEFRRFENDAVAAGARIIVTTEKDSINLSAEAIQGSRVPVYASRIEFKCEDEGTLRSLVLRAIIDRQGDRECRTTSTSSSGT